MGQRLNSIFTKQLEATVMESPIKDTSNKQGNANMGIKPPKLAKGDQRLVEINLNEKVNLFRLSTKFEPMAKNKGVGKSPKPKVTTEVGELGLGISSSKPKHTWKIQRWIIIIGATVKGTL